MTRSLSLILALVAAGAVGLLIARCVSGDGRGAAPRSVERTTPAISSDLPRRIARAPLPDGPFDSIRMELVSRANSGDADAAYRLGQVISRCMTFVSISDSAFDNMIAKAGIIFGRTFRILGQSIDDQDMLDVLLHHKDEMDQTCAGTGELRRSGRVADAYPWIHRAAELGHTGAMAEYADHAFTEFTTHADLLDHASEVARRRDLATEMLDRALLSGEPKALMALAKAHDKGGLLRRDRVRALAYWKAYGETNDGSAPPGLRHMGDEHYRRGLDAAQQAQAENLAIEILAKLRAVSPMP